MEDETCHWSPWKARFYRVLRYLVLLREILLILLLLRQIVLFLSIYPSIHGIIFLISVA